MKKLKKIVALAVAISIIFAIPSVFANTDGKLNAEIVKKVIEKLTLYSRYDDIHGGTLYKEGLIKALEEHPEIYETVMEALLSRVDENSEYYNTTDAKLMRENITGIVVGIGITFQMGPEGVEVVSVIKDMPAYNVGIQVGDIIVSADDVSLKGMNSDTAASYIRGEIGSTVKLGVKREGESAILYLDLVRQEITGTSVESFVYEEGDKKLMYICIYGFISNTAESFNAALLEAKEKGISDLIIDLRDNGGGLLDQAVLMADYMVPKDSLITTEDHKIDILDRNYRATLEDDVKFNTVILINENSASASEVLTAALYENDCAYIIGRKSYGKGTIQTVNDLPYGDMMKYTVGYYLTPKGNNIHGKGIEPDLEVSNETTDFDMTPYPKYEYIKVYAEGDKGPEIKMTKELLKAWGTFNGEINEEYDKELASAVYKFQAGVGLYPYGVLDYTTQHELYERMSSSKVVHDNQLQKAFEYFGMRKAE